MKYIEALVRNIISYKLPLILFASGVIEQSIIYIEVLARSFPPTVIICRIVHLLRRKSEHSNMISTILVCLAVPLSGSVPRGFEA
jgi:hypothetical protein